MDFSKISDAEILKIGNPIWENMIAGFNEEDYSKFSRDFSQIMLKIVNEEEFKRQISSTNQDRGKLSHSNTFIGCIRRGSGVTLLWNSSLSDIRGELLAQITIDEVEEKIEVIHSFVG